MSVEDQFCCVCVLFFRIFNFWPKIHKNTRFNLFARIIDLRKNPLHCQKSFWMFILFLLFSSISLHWSLRKTFLSLLALLWNSAFKWVYLFFSPLVLASLLFTAICKVITLHYIKASSNSHFAFLHFFSVGMVLIPFSCTMSQTSIHSSSGTLSIRSRPFNLLVTSTV